MKKPEDVRGYGHCPNFEQCPICYGCRAADLSYVKCIHCAEDPKTNICNRYKHRPELLSKMITRQKVEII